MLANFSLSRALTLIGLSSLIMIGTFPDSQSSLAATDSDQRVVSGPDRRKAGASRQIASPDRRKSGASRQIASPDRRKSGSSRTDIAQLLDQNFGLSESPYRCTQEVSQLVALIPENLQGLTVNPTPTLYFAVPALSTNPDIEFVLQDEQQQVIYKAKVKSTELGGIMSLQIPESHALEVNKNYHWYLSVVCDRQHRERDVVVEGLIQQIEIDTASVSTSSDAQIQFYRQNGLWYDALQTVIQSNKQATWQELMQSVNLSELSNLLSEKPTFKAVPEPLTANTTLIGQVN
jgi:hypothetical protein